MAFMIHSTGDHRAPVLMRRPCSAIAPKVGQAMVLNGGLLKLATGTTKPKYISMREQDNACTAGDEINVIQADPDIVFETTFAVDAAAVKIGSMVTIHTDGEQVTATTDGGVAEVVAILGTAAGDKVRVRFP